MGPLRSEFASVDRLVVVSVAEVAEDDGINHVAYGLDRAIAEDKAAARRMSTAEANFVIVARGVLPRRLGVAVVRPRPRLSGAVVVVGESGVHVCVVCTIGTVEVVFRHDVLLANHERVGCAVADIGDGDLAPHETDACPVVQAVRYPVALFRRVPP